MQPEGTLIVFTNDNFFSSFFCYSKSFRCKLQVNVILIMYNIFLYSLILLKVNILMICICF